QLCAKSGWEGNLLFWPGVGAGLAAGAREGTHPSTWVALQQRIALVNSAVAWAASSHPGCAAQQIGYSKSACRCGGSRAVHGCRGHQRHGRHFYFCQFMRVKSRLLTNILLHGQLDAVELIPETSWRA